MKEFGLALLATIITSLLFFLIFFLGYKSNENKNTKQIILKVTFMLLSLGLAFLLVKKFTFTILNFDFSKIGIYFKIGTNSYGIPLDAIEDLVVYSPFFTGLYDFFPSLKQLFQELPHLLFAPFIFQILFFLFLIIFMPFYAFFGKERKEKKNNYLRKTVKKKKYVSSGIVGGIEAVFLVSIILLPINSINRAYHMAMDDTFGDDKVIYHHIENLGAYSKVFDILDYYDSSIFGVLSKDKSLDAYLFREITKIENDGKTSNLENEIRLILRSTVVMNQIGFINALSASMGVEALLALDFSTLNEESIDLVVDSIIESKFTHNLLQDLFNVMVDILNQNMATLDFYDKPYIEIDLDSIDLDKEIRIILNAFKFLADNDFMKIFGVNMNVLTLDDILTMFEVDSFVDTIIKIFESDIFSKFVIHIVNNVIKDLGVVLDISNREDLISDLNILRNILKIFKNHNTTDFLQVFASVNEKEKLELADFFNDMVNSNVFSKAIPHLLNNIRSFVDLKEYHFKEIKDWRPEIELLVEAVKILNAIDKKQPVKIASFVSTVNKATKSKLAGPIILSFTSLQVEAFGIDAYNILLNLLK